MPPKRKLELSDPLSRSSRTKTKLAKLDAPKHEASEDSLTISLAPSSSAPARPSSSSATSSLIPRGPRSKAQLGQKSESLLRMACDDTVTGEMKEMHFRNIAHSSIEWNNPLHINKINNWRNQIYGRAGMKHKTIVLWLSDEKLWMELYFQLSIAESRKRGMLLPTTPEILVAFNKMFVGRVLQHKGRTMEPRGERKLNAFTSKFNRTCLLLRARLNQCLVGKSGDVFIPEISYERLQAYKQMKEKLGLGKETEAAYAEGLSEWNRLFMHLPGDDIGVRDEPVATAQDVAAGALMSLAGYPVKC